jgi:trehalose 6-phosphate synthase
MGADSPRKSTLSDHALRGHPLIVVSNRGPAEFVAAGDGSHEPRPGAGGLVTALSGCLKALPHLDVTWVALAMTEGDRAAFADGEPRSLELAGRPIRVRYISVPHQAYHLHYDVVSNQMLWFIQHYLWSPEVQPLFGPQHHRAWHEGYAVVNGALAQAAGEEVERARQRASKPPIVLVQDYQLYLVPGAIRSHCLDAMLACFVHIPWPASRYLEWLPSDLITSLYVSLARCDTLGFQTPRDGENFIEAARDVLPDASARLDRSEIEWEGRRTHIGVYPVTVDAQSARRSAQVATKNLPARPPVRQNVRTIIRVDRVEPTKNIVGGFLAFRALLREHPELGGKVLFRAFLVPSRQNVPAYQRTRQEVLRLARDINRRYSAGGFPPIELVQGNDRPRALAALREADVVLVNPLLDGMNLVAKEAAVVNERDGVLVLSRAAGAHRELEGACLSVTPTDIVETTSALYQALTMSQEERRRLARRAREIVESSDPASWLMAQLTDTLASCTRRSRRSARTRQPAARGQHGA